MRLILKVSLILFLQYIHLFLWVSGQSSVIYHPGDYTKGVVPWVYLSRYSNYLYTFLYKATKGFQTLEFVGEYGKSTLKSSSIGIL